MTVFWKTVTLTASVKAERILFRLPAMQKNFTLCRTARSSDSPLCGIAQSRFSFTNKSFICDSALCNSMWNSSQQFFCRLRAMRHSGESTPRYAAYRGVWLHAMRHSAELQLRAMRHSAESQLPAMRHSAGSIFVVEFNRIAPRIRIYMKNRFSPWIRGPRGTV
jgi:hypothetical protein